jgi:uncharacterized protein (DUF486 family)
VPLSTVILISWGMAFIESHYPLLTFAAFSVLYLKEPLGWNYGVGFALIAVGAFFVFHKW